MKRKLSKLLPPGAEVKQTLYSCLLLLFVELGISFGYLFVFFDHLNSLYYVKFRKRYLFEDAMMPTLNELLAGKLFGFVILAAGCIALAVGHYLMFTRESKSIYLMKRLKDPADLHRRCLTVPALCLACGVVLAALLLGLYTLLYFWLTPTQCLPLNQTFQLWRCML